MLYRKYRPRTFSEVVGQEHVVKTLQGALTTNRIGHAYLFSGPRGTGKTTIARILAKSLNCTNLKQDGNPDDKCDFCTAINEGRSLDLIEIDAASNRGIDEIRNLKESALVAAPSGKYKIFIIDEVHMLTKDAFNALLKILEEPPAHVVFILATTEPHKILPTVLSRVQRFDFKRLTAKEIFGKLKEIAGLEKIDVEDEGLMAIAVSSDGALRDAEVSLSKVRSSVYGKEKITGEKVGEILGLIPINYHPEFFGYLAGGDKISALNFIHKIYESGADLENFSKDFIEYMRKVLMAKVNPVVLAYFMNDLTDETAQLISNQAKAIEDQRLIRMINIFSSARSEIKISPIAPLPLELAVMEIIGEN